MTLDEPLDSHVTGGFDKETRVEKSMDSVPLWSRGEQAIAFGENEFDRLGHSDRYPPTSNVSIAPFRSRAAFVARIRLARWKPSMGTTMQLSGPSRSVMRAARVDLPAPGAPAMPRIFRIPVEVPSARRVSTCVMTSRNELIFTRIAAPQHCSK